MELNYPVIDERRPEKFVANRELNQIRLTWFPAGDGQAQSYEIFRGEGMHSVKTLLTKTVKPEYVDTAVQPDHVYEYHVVAVDARGRQSPPSCPDAARALSQPRLWDAEIVDFNIPNELIVGQSQMATVTIRNTGSKEWDLRRESGMRIWLQTAQLWNEKNDGFLPQVGLGEPRVIPHGSTFTVTFPYVGRIPGKFQNHWVMRLEAKGGSGAWFGTPLRVQTIVRASSGE